MLPTTLANQQFAAFSFDETRPPFALPSLVWADKHEQKQDISHVFGGPRPLPSFSNTPTHSIPQPNETYEEADQIFDFFGVHLSPPPVDESCQPYHEQLPIPAPTMPTVPVKHEAPTPSIASSSSASVVSAPSPSHNPQLVQAHKTITDLECTIESMSLRIKHLESLVAGQARDSVPSAQSPPVRVERTPEVKPVPVSRPSQPNGQLALELVGGMETEWYCDRPYPTIKFSLKNNNAPSGLNFKVKVSLLDGYDAESQQLGGPASTHNFEFESNEEGIIEVSNIRFTQVSSKSGGHYTLVVSAFSLGPDARPLGEFKSNRMTILSYRLFNARKFDFDRLSANDPLSKVKGIGSLYAQRFAALGIRTVEHLSLLVTNEEEQTGKAAPGQKTCSDLVASLRKVRGTLTQQKLEEYVLQARAVVTRECSSNNQPILSTNSKRCRGKSNQFSFFDGPPQPKRRCVNIVEPTTLPTLFDSAF